MTDEGCFRLNVMEELSPYFDDSSLPTDDPSQFVLLVGGPATGKTTLRKERYATGYALVDSVPIFLHLCRGAYLDFPGSLEEPMQLIGLMVAERAVSERRHIVTEMIGDDADQLTTLIDAMLAIGYKADLVYVDCPFEDAVRRNLNRDEDCISAFYAGKYQYEWLLEAAKNAKTPKES